MGLVVLAGARAGWAQCAMDTDCKGERICEQGKCREPAPSALSSPIAAPPPPVVKEASVAAPAMEAPKRAALSDSEPPLFEEEPRPKPKRRIGRPGMMATGIVLTSLAPVVLVIGALSLSCSDSSTDSCRGTERRLVGIGLVSAALVGVGVPLIVIGAKRVPVRQVAVGPWFAPREAGLRLQLAL